MMNIPTLTLKTGRKIPRLGLGTWTIGGRFARDMHNDDIGQIKGIQSAIDQGITLIRTAQNYAGGYCESLIGEAIREYDRSKLYVVVSANENFAVDRQTMKSELQGSLSRLGIDSADLFIMGGINPLISQTKIAEGLLGVLSEGMATDIGVGNYRQPEFEFLDSLTEGKIVYNEMQYNLVIREPGVTGLLDHLREKQVILSAYRPLQNGQLSKPGIKILDDLSEKYCVSPTQIALKWILTQENVTTIPKVISDAHLKEISSLFEWELSDEDQQKLTQDFPIQCRWGDCLPPIPNFTK